MVEEDKIFVPGKGMVKTKLTPVAFDIAKNDASILELEDGSVLRFTVVFDEVFKTDQTTPDGTPIYLVRSNNNVYARARVKEVKK